jgi:serine/threonine protein kinase
MLRCPKCSRIYQTGSQRFCTHDGGRLSDIAQDDAHNGGSFHSSFGVEATTAAAAAAQNDSGNTAWQPRRQTGRLVLPPHIELTPNGFATPAVAEAKKVASSRTVEGLLANSNAAATTPPVIERRTTGRLVLPSEIPPSYAPTGNRREVPTGRLPVSSKNTEVLLGQNIKGRYQLDRILWQDETTVSYLGRDRFTEARRVVVKLLLDDAPSDSEFGRRFAEEKVALSNINHPSIVNILDSGELVEGKPFVIFEYVQGEPLRDIIQKFGKFMPARTGRIIRQVAQSLSEAHNNRLLHRNLHPGNIILKSSEYGAEQIKVTQFGITGFEDLYKPEFFAYQSPERLAGEQLSPESDIFSLGVVAFEMLTGRQPFGGALRVDWLEAQERGLALHPTNLRLDLSPAVDAVLERALDYRRENRFHLAREFGEALYTALTEKTVLTVGQTAVLPQTKQTEIAAEEAVEEKIIEEKIIEEKIIEEKIVAEKSTEEKIENLAETFELDDPSLELDGVSVETEIKIEPQKSALEKAAKNVEITRVEKVVQKEARRKSESSWLLIAACLAGVVLLIGAFWLMSARSINGDSSSEQPISISPATQTSAPIEIAQASQQPISDVNQNADAPAPNANQNFAPPLQLSAAVAARPVPENFVRFENKQENLSGKLADKFVSFSLAYPNEWQRNPDEKKAGVFLDVANRVSTGLPLEQIVASWYESKGSFDADRAAFSGLTKKLIAVYAKDIPQFKKISEGKAAFRGREAYELKFTGRTEDANGETVQIWGRTIFLPTGENGNGSGLLVTMLATSLAPTLSNVDDVGEKGELAQILETFSPAVAGSISGN